jgi:hypothetical protein
MIYLAILAMCSIVPLYVWGATGDWRHALTAARQYLKIIGAFVLVGGGLGVVMAVGGLYAQ